MMKSVKRRRLWKNVDDDKESEPEADLDEHGVVDLFGADYDSADVKF